LSKNGCRLPHVSVFETWDGAQLDPYWSRLTIRMATEIDGLMGT